MNYLPEDNYVVRISRGKDAKYITPLGAESCVERWNGATAVVSGHEALTQDVNAAERMPRSIAEAFARRFACGVEGIKSPLQVEIVNVQTTRAELITLEV